jgi:integrase
MASIRQRNGKWQARVIRKGHPPQARTFSSKQDAERWARGVETEIDRGSYTSRTEADRTTLGDVIARYCAEVTPGMRSARDDLIRLRAIQRHPLCANSMGCLTPAKVAAFRDQRLRQVQPGTVIRELAYLSAIINHARREWGIHCVNPVALVKKPEAPPGRDRVLSAGEEVRLLAALVPSGRRSPWLLPIVELALQSAMRRGELLGLRWGDVRLTEQVAVLPFTKNGDRRLVPLSTGAVRVLSSVPRALHDDRVFPIQAATVAKAFDRAAARAGLSGLRFHDLRHTAITRMAAKLPNVIELAAVSGHRSLRMLQRYYHPNPQELATKLG